MLCLLYGYTPGHVPVTQIDVQDMQKEIPRAVFGELSKR